MEEELKIAMLGHKRIPSREGGIEIVVEELSKRLVALGHSVTCYNRRGSHVSNPSIKVVRQKYYEDIRIKYVPTINRKGLAALTSSFFASVRCAFGNYNVVHFHAEGTCAFMWIPKLFGKKCVATIHGLDWAREKWRGSLGEKYIKFGEKVAVKYADEIIVLSNGLQDYFQTTYGRDTRYIPNGITKPEVLPAQLITRKFGLHKDDYILYLGRIVPEKGLRYLIHAYKNIEIDKKLVIAGGSSDTGGFYEEIKQMSDNGDGILFTGFVDGQLLAELYSNAYIYILPSDLEGMPISLLEAMSYGNCCLVSSIQECTEVVDNKAMIFNKADVSDLTKKLKWLLANPQAVQSYKEQSADYILKKYDWDEVTYDIVQLYREHIPQQKLKNPKLKESSK